jgi:chromosome segregation ATPase
MSLAHDMSGRTIDPTLRLLANPDLLQKRLDQLENAQKAAQAVIDRAGPIEDIERARVEIEDLKAKAEAQEQHAREECERLISEAGDAAGEITRKAQEQANKLVAEAESRNSGAKLALERAEGAMAAVESKERALQVRVDELGDAEANLQQKAEELASRENELIGEKARLAEVRDAINSVL